jgi:putative ABC transport system permease protein
VRTGEIVREVLASARAQKVPTIMVALLSAAMCLTTLLTVGRSAAAQTQVLERLDQAGSRTVVVRDSGSEALLNPGVIATINALGPVEAAIATGVARDVTNGPLGGRDAPKVPSWTVVGDIEVAAEVLAGRMPQPGEALVSAEAQRALGMDAPFGYVTDGTNEYQVVGSFRARPVAEALANGVLVSSPSTSGTTLTILASSAKEVGTATSAALSVLRPIDPQSIRVESPQTLAQVQGQVSADLGDFSRSLLLGVLAAGAALTAVVVLADVLVRRADLGRRRALGATRGVITALVAGRTVLSGVGGAVVGMGVGLVLTTRMDAAPPLDFALGTAALAVLAASAASVPPALFAANRDPVRVLRTP